MIGSPAPVATRFTPEYNHDLNPGEAFLQSYPEIQAALFDPRLWAQFQEWDRESKRHKARFQQLGAASLVFAVVPLCAAAVRVVLATTPIAFPAALTALFEFCGLVSVALIILLHVGRHRVRWCEAMFTRERLRQWHFQRFLDGDLMKLLVTNRSAYDAALGARWNQLLLEIRQARGMMVEFAAGAKPEHDLFHKAVPYDNRALFTTVCSALSALRLQHQAAYTALKLEGQTEVIALKERNDLSEQFAVVSLGAAVATIAVAFIVSLAYVLPVAPRLPWDEADVARTFGGCALLFAVLSAAARAYRSGYTVPDEVESYEEYRDRVRQIDATFASVPVEAKLGQLERLEIESTAELRRFLRLKLRATFVF
jgi:hypothetical protein